MRIIAADSACSTLDAAFMPADILASAVILLDHPYREPAQVRHVAADYRLSDPNVLVYELRLCQQMLETETADCVHLDLSFGGLNLLSITDEMLWRTPLSTHGREVLRLVLPDLQALALSIGERFKVPVYAVGDKSGAVRLAELTAAAGGVARAAQRALTADAPVTVGLPRHTRAIFEEGRVTVASTEPMELGLIAGAEAPEGVDVEAFLNPVAREFQALRLTGPAA